MVDQNDGLATVNITDKSGEKVVDKLIVPTNGVNDKITGILFLSGRYQSVMKLDNILVRMMSLVKRQKKLYQKLNLLLNLILQLTSLMKASLYISLLQLRQQVYMAAT